MEESKIFNVKYDGFKSLMGLSGLVHWLGLCHWLGIGWVLKVTQQPTVQWLLICLGGGREEKIGFP